MSSDAQKAHLLNLLTRSDPFSFNITLEDGREIVLGWCKVVGFSFDVETKIRTYILRGFYEGNQWDVSVPLQEH